MVVKPKFKKETKVLIPNNELALYSCSREHVDASEGGCH